MACNSGDRSFAECGIQFDDSNNCMSFAGVQCVTLGECSIWEGNPRIINTNKVLNYSNTS